MPAEFHEIIALGGRARCDLGASREHVIALYNADPTRRIIVDELLHQIDSATGSGS